MREEGVTMVGCVCGSMDSCPFLLLCLQGTDVEMNDVHPLPIGDVNGGRHGGLLSILVRILEYASHRGITVTGVVRVRVYCRFMYSES